MHFLALLAAAASLATSSKELRPPPSLDQAILGALPDDADFGTSRRVIEMPCPECRVGPNKSVRELPLDHEPRPGETFPESVLRVNISIGHDGDMDKLMVNDCSFYPLPSRCTTVWTDQFVKSPCGTWEYAASPEGAFRLTMHYLDDNISGLEIKLQMLELVIQRLGSKLIFGKQPEIKVKLLVFPYGQIMIATDPARAPTKGPAPKPDCGHHHHRHHLPDYHHNWFSSYVAFVVHALMPVIGGLIVASSTFYIWRKRFLGRQRAVYSRVLLEVDSIYDDKVRGYVDHPDAPLLDEDAPPYEEVPVTKKPCQYLVNDVQSRIL